MPDRDESTPSLIDFCARRNCATRPEAQQDSVTLPEMMALPQFHPGTYLHYRGDERSVPRRHLESAMSSRKPGYIVGIAVLALILSLPQIVGGLVTGWEVYHRVRTGRPYQLLGPTPVHHSLEVSSFWQGKFAHTIAAHRGLDQWTIRLTNPETGEFDKLDLSFPGRSFLNFVPFVAGNRIWVLGRNGSFEIVDGALQDSKLVAPPLAEYDGRNFLWKGDPAVISMSPAGFTVSAFQNGIWTVVGHVDVPDFGRERMFGGLPIRFVMGSFFSGTSRIQVLHSDDGLHVFLHHEGRLFHHQGLDLNVESLPTLTVYSKSNPNSPPPYVVDPDHPVSALKPSNSDADLAGWTLIGDTPVIGNQAQVCAFGMLIAGQPAALIVENAMSGNAIGHLYKHDGTTWNEVESLAFPFGSFRFRAVTTHDGQRSYVVTSTATGLCHVYALDSTGLRKVNDFDENSTSLATSVYLLGQALFVLLMLGVVLGAATGLLMRWFTKPEYEFGMQTVRLASLCWRGIARLIDLGLIVSTTIGLGWLMTRGFDWQSLIEALNMNVPHATIPVAKRIVTILGIWLVAVASAMLTTQAVWGMTPGKWLCGLRTLRTSLRPCRYPRSLVREIVFFVDCCNFICWTPGIVSIAFTDRRQRLGDLVADTIVVEWPADK
jgi:uncharacterized RDD family membrane protein YckC